MAQSVHTGRKEEPTMNDWRHQTFANALERISCYRNNEALVYHHERLTYLEFKKRVDRISKGLIALGVQKGDRVAVWLPNFPEWILAQWAIAQDRFCSGVH
jgi:fatty-acyl-CoA synthase